MILFAAWTLVQVFLFAVSAWFIVFGIRVFSARKGLAILLFAFGFAGLYGVYEALWTVTKHL